MSGTKPVKCPLCNESIEWDDDLKLGEIAYCSDCDEELKVVNVDPPQLKRMVELLEVSNGSYKGFYEDPFYKDEDDLDSDSDSEEV